MFKFKVFISISIFSFLLIGTSFLKNETREIEKKIHYLGKSILQKEKDLNESQMDFFYLTSPSMIEKSINHLSDNQYLPMEYSKIFLSMSNFLDLHNKYATQEKINEKKKQKK